VALAPAGKEAARTAQSSRVAQPRNSHGRSDPLTQILLLPGALFAGRIGPEAGNRPKPGNTRAETAAVQRFRFICVAACLSSICGLVVRRRRNYKPQSPPQSKCSTRSAGLKMYDGSTLRGTWAGSASRRSSSDAQTENFTANQVIGTKDGVSLEGDKFGVLVRAGVGW
jgi:hypothetical protein